MSDNKHTGLSGKGYYIALILCAAAIGITGYVYQRNSKPQDHTLQETLPQEVVVAGTMSTQADVAVIATTPQTLPPATRPTEATQPPRKELQTGAPVAGEEIFGYSMEVLSYNQTTRDWRVHNGVDIAAAEGTQVRSAAAGQVVATYEDDALGCTVVIRHDGGYTTQYSSLGEALSVMAGDTVELGQVIGTVGATALTEAALGAHVHFSVTCQGQAMDPAEFLKLGA